MERQTDSVKSNDPIQNQVFCNRRVVLNFQPLTKICRHEPNSPCDEIVARHNLFDNFLTLDTANVIVFL